MKKEFLRMIEIAKVNGPKRMTVACPYHSSSILSSILAQKEGLAEPIFIGDRNIIENIASENDIDISEFELIDIKDDQEACDMSVKLVTEGKADFIMKGLVDTSKILKSYLKPEYNMRTDKLLSHVAIFIPETYYKILFVTDASMNIAPTLDQKRQIIDNAVEVARKIGVEIPKVACLAAIEKVNPKMKETVEARALQEMNEEGIIKNCLVAGPLALDNAIYEKAAKIKNISHPVAGHADILMVPNIEIGNILYKAFAFCSKAKHAGVIVGGKTPVVLTSRSDDENGKFNSIAFAKYLIETGDGYNKL